MKFEIRVPLPKLWVAYRRLSGKYFIMCVDVGSLNKLVNALG